MSDPASPNASYHNLSWVLFGIIALGSALFSLLVVSPDYWIDDSFIGFRFARNLSDGHGLVYNPGEYVEGFTSFLWVIVSYLGVEFGNPMAFVQGVGILSQILTLLLVFLIGKRITGSGLRALIAPALLAVSVSFVTYPMTGMDTSFFTMLVTLAAYLYLVGFHKHRIGKWVVGLVLLSIALTRFDGLIMVGIFLGYKVVFEREFRDVLPGLIVFVIGIIIFNVWRMTYYNTLLPNTFYAKVSFPKRQLIGGLRYLKNFTLGEARLALPLAFLPLFFGRMSKSIRFIGAIVLGHFLYVFVIGGDWMPFFRFALPVLPLLYVLAQQGFLALYDMTEQKIDNTAFRNGLIAGALSVIFVLHVNPLYEHRDFLDVVNGGLFAPKQAYRIGEHLSETLPEDYVVAVEWAGIIPYYLRQPVLDIFGLNDKDIIEKDFPGARMGRSITPEYLVERNPEVLVLCARTFETVEKAAAGAQLRVTHTPPDSRIRRFYASLIGPEFAYDVCVMKIDESAYWPFLLRSDLHEKHAFCVEEKITTAAEKVSSGS